MKTTRTLLLLLAPVLAHAATNVDNTANDAYGANIGWVNCQGDVTNGAVVGEFICSGYLYSANCGWIHLGDGTPANGIRYLNNSGTDYGVNTQDYTSNGVTYEAKLRGFAYGANIGWVNFEANGNPRVDLTTGQLLGFAWSANCGWIALSGAGVNVKITSLIAGADTDGDGMTDAWERTHAPNLTTLGIGLDKDGDGELDTDEFAADTDPDDVNDRLQITLLIPPRQVPPGGPFATDLTWTSKPTRKYDIERVGDLTLGFGVAAANIVPSAGLFTAVQFADPNATAKFYRIRAKRPLTP